MTLPKPPAPPETRARRRAPRRALGALRPAALLAAVLALTLLQAPAPASAEADFTTEADPAPGPMPRPAAEQDEAAEAEASASPSPSDLFALPRVAGEMRRLQILLEGGDGPPEARLAAARETADALAARYPTLAVLHTARASLAMLAGDLEAAVEALDDAVDHGFVEIDALLAQPAFAPLAERRPDPAAGPRLDPPARLAKIIARAEALPPPAPPAPAPLDGGEALVSAANTAWNPQAGRLEAHFDASALPRDRAVVAGAARRGRAATAQDHLEALHRRGQAAGNAGDLYDNRDRGHSRLDLDNHPQVSSVAYSAEARAADLDYGLADGIVFDRVTFGNSSTAITGGPFWRSLGREALTRADGLGPWRLFERYASNHVYVYPSHQDHDPEGWDLFPANTPYVILSQGSSRSDRPFLEAVAMALAAFRPDTKARLAETGLVAPTVQFVLRRSLRGVLSREAYLSGAAHPTVFRASEIGLARMVSLANAIAPDAIPPMVRLEVVEEERPRQGVDIFGQGLDEVLFDTPSAAARVWRGKAYTRRYVLSTEATEDSNGRPLAFHWSLLRGDPARVRITPEEGGRRALVEIDWHEPRPVSGEDAMLSARVDIGVFANNGAHDSAPAIFSLAFPAHETRRYEEGPDGAMRVAAIDYADPEKSDVYADPMLMPRPGWRDEYRYDAEGGLEGWTRTEGGRTDEYDAGGARILARDAEGRPTRTEPVAYAITRHPDGRLAVEELSAPGG